MFFGFLTTNQCFEGSIFHLSLRIKLSDKMFMDYPYVKLVSLQNKRPLGVGTMPCKFLEQTFHHFTMY